VSEAGVFIAPQTVAVWSAMDKPLQHHFDQAGLRRSVVVHHSRNAAHGCASCLLFRPLPNARWFGLDGKNAL
jgi:hypothetical protein